MQGFEARPRRAISEEKVSDRQRPSWRRRRPLDAEVAESFPHHHYEQNSLIINELCDIEVLDFNKKPLELVPIEPDELENLKNRESKKTTHE